MAVEIKMKYGIDLGTTNSAICKMENGEPFIKKTDTLKDTLPSCVSFTKKQVVKVGDSAYNDLRQDKSRATKTWSRGKENVFLEFKRTMGLDTKYQSTNMGRDYNSEELSAEVLKALKTFVSEDTINAAVITIPAKFKPDQIAATQRAAKLAGIEHCELLQEPIAAAMAYGLSTSKKDGYWVVFDFGGGTFDAALLKIEDGVIKVIDTEGDNYLGGKNLDYAIVDGIIIPYLQENYVIDEILADNCKKEILREAMKFYAEYAKNQLSFKDKCDITSQLDEFGEDDEGSEIELDLVVTQEQLKNVLTPVFQKAVDICKQLIERNYLTCGKLDSLILVGGPTYSPVLRQMLKEQITTNVDTSIDPMTAVAKGAALYASTTTTVVSALTTQKQSLAFEVTYESNSVETVEYVTVKLLPNECKGKIPNKVFVELVRGDKAWSSGKVEINTIGDVFECLLNEGKANMFTINAYDDAGNIIPCFPNEISIIQGFSTGSAVLPRHIGIEVTNKELSKDVFVPLKGLEKNKQLPAVGVRNGLKTPKQIRPGITDDKLVIPIYVGEHNAEGTSAIYNDHVFDVVITGDDVPALIPKNSDIDITIKVDRSQMMHLDVTFPVIGETVEKDIEIAAREGVKLNDLIERLDEAKRKMHALKSSGAISNAELSDAENTLNDVVSRFEGEKNSEDGKMHLLQSLREAFLKMEEVEKNHEWDSLEAELRSEFERLEEADNDLGDSQSHTMIGQLRIQIDNTIRQKDVKEGRLLLNEIKELFFRLTIGFQLIGFIRHHHENFNNIPWKNPSQARQLLNQGLDICNNKPNMNQLRPIVIQLIALMDVPESEKPEIS